MVYTFIQLGLYIVDRLIGRGTPDPLPTPLPQLPLSVTHFFFWFQHSNLATQIYICEWFMVYRSSDRGVAICQSIHQARVNSTRTSPNRQAGLHDVELLANFLGGRKHPITTHFRLARKLLPLNPVERCPEV